MSQPPVARPRRKLLIAAAGVATLNLAGCGSMVSNSGNLMAPPPCSFPGDSRCPDAGTPVDAGAPDAGPSDAGH